MKDTYYYKLAAQNFYNGSVLIAVRCKYKHVLVGSRSDVALCTCMRACMQNSSYQHRQRKILGA